MLIKLVLVLGLAIVVWVVYLIHLLNLLYHVMIFLAAA
jgi:hypothetical protein